MINWMILLAAVSAIAVSQSIFLGIINIIDGRKNSRVNIYLGLLLIALGLRVGKSLVYYFWPGIAMVGVSMGGAGLWAAGPSLYFYVRSFSGNSISRLQLILFYAPAIILFILGATLFTMPVMRIVYLSGSGVLAAGLLASFILFVKNGSRDNGNWLAIVQSGVLIMCIMFVYQLYSPNIQAYALGAIVASVILYIINFKGIGLQTVSTAVQSGKSLSSKQLDTIGLSISKVFEQERIYREQKLTLGKVAERIQTPQYLLRKAIQQIHNKNFNDFVNEFRISELKDRLSHDNKYTIEAMASEVGFTSNSTFYEAFRKVMGCTPAEYRKGLLRDSYSESNTGSLHKNQPA